MSLERLRERLSLLQIVVACATVLAGGAMRVSSAIIAAGFVAWAFYRPLPPAPSATAQRAWTVLVFVALAASVARALLLGEVLDAGVDFLLLLVVQRFFQRQRAREHLQLLALGALLVIVGAVVNTGLNYPVLFAVWLVSTCMALIVNHLLAEAERLGRRVQLEVTRAAARSRATLWKASLGTAGFALAGGLAVFLLFPRFGVGVFLRGPMAQERRSGFSGEVELGGFGRIKTDPTVIARLRPVDGDDLPSRLTWYLRGSSLDRYEAGRWTQGREGETTPLHRTSTFMVPAPNGQAVGRLVLADRDVRLQPVEIEGFAASTESTRVQVLLEDQGVDVLFAASDIIGVGLITRGMLEQRNNKIRGGYNGELHVDKLPGPVQYEFVSRITTPTSRELQAVGQPPMTDALLPYLQGRGEFSPALTELARSLAADQPTRYAQVQAVLAHLQTLRYSLDVPEPSHVLERDPIETFLFETQAGHCEYFATALAVLLREVGVPARIVNGYYGAHYNELGDFYAVRQADAHSWVEVHFGPLGWVTFDPTPPDGRTAGDAAARWPAWSQALDAMRNAYLEYVIDYDLQKQLAMLRGLGGNRRAHQRFTPDGERLAWLGAGLVTVFVGVRLWRRRTRPVLSLERRLYADIVRRYTVLGFARHPHESPMEWARRIAADGAPQAETLVAFARQYDALRFGPTTAAAGLPALRRMARTLVSGARSR